MRYCPLSGNFDVGARNVTQNTLRFASPKHPWARVSTMPCEERMKIMHPIVAVTLFAAVASAQSPKNQASESTGVCSYYASKYDGHITAGGEKFDSNAMTAAHRTLPMGTRLKVTNISNGKSVVVKVNDRGPFVKGRSLSVTRHAAEELGFIKEGIAKVSFEQVK